jgi:hypothetical protein
MIMMIMTVAQLAQWMIGREISAVLSTTNLTHDLATAVGSRRLAAWAAAQTNSNTYLNYEECRLLGREAVWLL